MWEKVCEQNILGKIWYPYLQNNAMEQINKLSETFKEKTKMNQKNYARHLQYLKENPWQSRFNSIKNRCNSPTQTNFYWYGGRGIKCHITASEIKQLWFRDKAYLMKKPSIDRIDSNGHYEFSNCRFIENIENSRRAHIGKHYINSSRGCGIVALTCILLHDMEIYRPCIEKQARTLYYRLLLEKIL